VVEPSSRNGDALTEYNNEIQVGSGLSLSVVRCVVLLVAFVGDASRDRRLGHRWVDEHDTVGSSWCDNRGDIIVGLARKPVEAELSQDARDVLATFIVGEDVASPAVLELLGDIGFARDVDRVVLLETGLSSDDDVAVSRVRVNKG